MSEKNKKSTDILPATFAFIIFLFLSPIFIIFNIIMRLKKTRVAQKLKQKYKGEFIEMMEKRDAIFAMDEGDMRNSVESIAYVEMNNDKNHIDFFNYLRTCVSDLYESKEEPYNKAFYTRGFDLDYYFWKRQSNFKIDDYVQTYNFKTKQEYIDYNTAKAFVNEIANKPYSLNDTTILSIYIGDKPILDEKAAKNNKKVYVMLVRYHHCLGDGVAFKKFLFKIFKARHVAEDEKKIKTKMQNLTDRYKISKWKIIAYKIIAFYYMPLTLHRLRNYPNDKNILHGPKLSGKIKIGWKMDNGEDSAYMKIERIRKRIPNISFTQVILTALSHSYSAYYAKNENKMPMPSYMTLCMSMRIFNTNFHIDDKMKTIENNFSFVTIKLPISQNSDEAGFYKTMAGVKESLDTLKKSTELEAREWMAILIDPFPVSRLKKIFQRSPMTLSYTNLPGPAKLYLQDDFLIKDFTFTNPNRLETGVGMTFLTYEDSIEIGIGVDSVLMEHGDDLEFILDNFHASIKHMDEYTSQNEVGPVK